MKMQNNRWLQVLIVLLVIIASAWLAAQVWGFLLQFSSILLLFFLSWLIAFILRPLARWLNGRGMPYTLAVAVVYLSLALILVLGGILLVPVITTQTGSLVNNAGTYTTQIEGLVSDAQSTLKSWGVQASDLDKISSQLLGQAQTATLSVLQNTLVLLQSIATLALQIVFIILISFYIMKDGDRLAAGILHLLPPRWEDEIRLIALSIEKSFGGFIRGQLLFALIYALLNAIIMLGFGLDYVVVASIVAGLCMIIPLVGNYLAYVPPMLVCVVTKPDIWVWVLLVLFLGQSAMMNFVGPRVMSSAIGLHPIYVVAALLVGGQIAGVWGALFGIPVAGAINLIGRPLFRRIRHQMPLYQEIGTKSLPTSAFVTGPLAASMAKANLRQLQTQSLSAANLPDDLASLESDQEDEEEPLPAVSQVSEETLADVEADADLIVKHNPTLTARAFRLIIVVGARSASWAWARARRQSGSSKEGRPATDDSSLRSSTDGSVKRET
jgi:predicted PurR-regulated permease PerM